MKKLMLSMVGICLLTTHIWANDYYVTTNGDDSADGTSVETAWKTIPRVNQASLLPGDKVLFQGGKTFYGNLQPSQGGTPEYPIVITSFGGARALIQAGAGIGFNARNIAGFEIRDINFEGSGASNTGVGIEFENAINDGVQLYHLRIFNVDVSRFRYGIVIGGTGWNKSGFTDVQVVGCDIHDNLSDGMFTYGYWEPTNPKYAINNIRVAYCRFYSNNGIPGQNTGHGIYLKDVENGTIEYCEAFDNGALGGSGGGPVGIWALDAKNITIQFNESHNNFTGNGVDGGGFDLDGGVSDSVMQYNYSHDNEGQGYLLYQFDGSRPWRNNVMRYNISQNDGLGIGQGAIAIGAQTNGNLQNAAIYNNTIYLASNGETSAVKFYSEVQNVTLSNNIFFVSGSAPIIRQDYPTATVRFSGNLYYNPQGFRAASGGHNFYSLEQWRRETGQEMSDGIGTGINANPLLVSPGGGGTISNPRNLASLTAYKLQPGSPAINGGRVFPRTTRDFYGNPVPFLDVPDIGAHEFSGEVIEPPSP